MEDSRREQLPSTTNSTRIDLTSSSSSTPSTSIISTSDPAKSNRNNNNRQRRNNGTSTNTTAGGTTTGENNAAVPLLEKNEIKRTRNKSNNNTTNGVRSGTTSHGNGRMNGGPSIARNEVESNLDQPPHNGSHIHPSSSSSDRTRRPPASSSNNNNRNGSTAAPPPTNRRARFNATLSSNATLDPTSSSFSPVTVTAPLTTPVIIIDPSTLTLSERLTSELSSCTADCSICFASLSRSAQIHSCSTCYTPFHLNCIHKWATHSITETSERARLLATRTNTAATPSSLEGNWRCPACQSTFPPALVPKQYRCFCLRVVNPSVRPNSTPHSCGNQCSRFRPSGCSHPCALLCHPGPCPPCAIVVEESCHCGVKEKIQVRCSMIHGSSNGSSATTRMELLSCRQVCGKTLKCGLHQCEEICHPGSCRGCEIMREKKCYCGRSGVEEKCGELRSEQSFECKKVGTKGEEGEGEKSWRGEWSCESVCDVPYDCDIHHCTLSCHPHLSAIPQSCPFSPITLKTCPCGMTRLATLLKTPRSSCTSPIPTCDKKCTKILECGHECSRSCHNGECGGCQEMIVVVCRCGSSKLSRRCAEKDTPIVSPSTATPLSTKSASTTLPSSLVGSTSASPTTRNTRTAMPLFISSVDVPPQPGELRCAKICRAMKSCGRHECGRRCCPLSYQEALRARSGGNGSGKKNSRRRGLDQVTMELEMVENDTEGVHACERVCARKLSCGRHLCEARDHKGPCPPCLLAGFDELICHCGSTVMLPPIACNAQIECRHPCIRQSSCGHPVVPHTCHEEGPCPPCAFLTKKVCRCGKTTMANVRCATDSTRVSCGITCGKLLRCGFHRCRQPCHVEGLCEPCTQICLKPRRLCSHPCPEECHTPSSCPIDSPCPKMIEVTCECGHIKQQARCATSEARPEGNAKRVVKCTDACVTLKRNTALADALGIEKREVKTREVEYDPLMLNFAKDNLVWCNSIETLLTEFILSDKNAFHFPSMRRPQRQFVHELAEEFDLRSESLDEEPRRSVVVTRQSTSATPSPTLSAALALRAKNGSNMLSFADLRTKRETDRKVNNALFLEEVGGYDHVALSTLLTPMMRGLLFKLEWVNETNVLVTFETSGTTTMANELESRLNLIQISLRHKLDQTRFCAAVETVAYSPIDGKITRGSWTPVLGSNRSAAGGRGGGNGTNAKLYSTNAFAALGATSGAAAAANNGEVGKRSWGSVLSGGMNKPPLAVVGSISSIERSDPPFISKPSDELVKEDWDAEDEEEEEEATTPKEKEDEMTKQNGSDAVE